MEKAQVGRSPDRVDGHMDPVVGHAKGPWDLKAAIAAASTGSKRGNAYARWMIMKPKPKGPDAEETWTHILWRGGLFIHTFTFNYRKRARGPNHQEAYALASASTVPVRCESGRRMVSTSGNRHSFLFQHGIGAVRNDTPTAHVLPESRVDRIFVRPRHASQRAQLRRERTAKVTCSSGPHAATRLADMWSPIYSHGHQADGSSSCTWDVLDEQRVQILRSQRPRSMADVPWLRDLPRGLRCASRGHRASRAVQGRGDGSVGQDGGLTDEPLGLVFLRESHPRF